jgi:hypothetical protein
MQVTYRRSSVGRPLYFGLIPGRHTVRDNLARLTGIGAECQGSGVVH